MKRLTKFFLIILALVLTCTAVAITSFAVGEQSERELISDVNWQYVDPYSGDAVVTTELTTALDTAAAGSTITLLRDYVISTGLGGVVIDKDIKLDLGGHTIYLVQNGKGHGLNPTDGVSLSVSNGTIVAASGSAYTTSTKTQAVFTSIGRGASLEITNVNIYGYALAYSWGAPYTITVNGGQHYVYTASADLTYPGWICGNSDITATVKNAEIYLMHSDARLVGFQNYKSTSNNPRSSATFDGCKIIASGPDHDIVSGLNRYSTLSFTNCDIFGKLAPVATSLDISKYNSKFSDTDKNPLVDSITIGAGCRVSRNVIGNSVVRWAPDVTVVDLDEAGKTATVELNVNAPSGYYTHDDFNITPSTVTVQYNLSDKAFVAPERLYKVVIGNTETYYNSNVELNNIISASSEGSTIYLLDDVTIVTNRYENPSKAGEYIATPIKVNKEITFDLGGHTLTIEQHAKNCGFYIETKKTVTFKNGNVATVAHTDFNSSGRTFAFMNANVSGVNVVFENVNSSVGSLIYSYDDTYTLTIKGGRHILSSTLTDMNTPGFISGQSNITATVTDATIYSNDKAVVGASSYKAISSKLTPNTSITFERCNIIATNAETNMIGNANQYTKVYFNGCYILGSITPSLNGSDSGKATIANESNFILGKMTFFSSKSNLSSAATTVANMSVGETAKSVCIDTTYYDFDRIVDSKYVTWYDENGSVLKRVMIAEVVGSLASYAPKYEGKGGVTNGWYKIGGYIANAWTDSINGTVATDLSAFDLSSVTDSISFYPLANENEISAYLSAALYNLSTVGAIRNNLYIPQTPDNVEILGVYVGEREVAGRLVLYRDYTDDPVYYTMYVINEVGATQFTKVTNVTVKYRVNGRIELEQPYTLSPEKYASIIYKDSIKTEGNSYSKAAYTVTADLVRYSYLLSTFGGINNPDLSALYDKMSDLCSTLPSDNSLAGSVTNVSALSGAGSISYEASSYEPRWKLMLNADAQVVDIKITMDGYYTGVKEDRTNFGALTYGIEGAVRNADGYITTAYSQNIPIYNIIQEFTITLIKADGSEISGTYDLKSYYTAIGKSTEAADFIKAVFSLAGSTAAFKFSEGKLAFGDVVDFWSCNHAGAEKQETIVSYIYNFTPRFCQRCDSWLFYYEDYGAAANGKTNRTRDTHVSGTNDYEAIYWTHANANEWKARAELSLGKHVAVVGNSDPKTPKYYYISLPEGRGIYTADANRDGIPEKKYNGVNLGSITIATDTSWNGVNLIIDDDAICNASGCSCVNALGVARKHSYNSQSIFVLDEYGTENYTESLKGKITSLSAGATNIGYAPGRKMLIQLTDANKKIYLRYGSNASNGASVTEVILVDEFGNVDPTTPVQWDYATITSATGYSVDTDPIKVSGLNGDTINASFESYVNNSMSISIPHYVSCNRNITIKRSNATIEGLERFFTEEVANSHKTNKRFAYTFIVAQLCSHPTIKDMIVINHNSQSGESGVGQGSYEFSGGSANAVSWINCVTKNMFSDSKAGAVQAYPIYRGLFGTNHIRNMYLKDCYLNSFDAHTGAYNVTIESSTVEHMNFIGGGDIIIKDVVVYCSNQGMAFNLRTDYGSTWHGDIYVDGLTIKYASTGSSKPARITLLKGSYENQYWGFDTYVPQVVTINNFHIQAYTATVSNGVRTETLGAMDDTANMPVYYYYALNTLKASSVPDESKAGIHGPTDKGDASITYDYGTNRLVCTKSITITNSASIIIPTGSYWKDMVVTVDGKTKKWTGDADSGTWN